VIRIQLRIVAGSLRGRKLNCQIDETVRPTPQMVREALFSILGDAVPGRPFFDVFAGTGAIGLEAVSRGASKCTFIERDVRLAGEIEKLMQTWQVTDKGRVFRADAYRWSERWLAPTEPINVYISPPFADFERRPQDLMQLIGDIQTKSAVGSVLVLQGEKGEITVDKLPAAGLPWEERRYGRNLLLIWVKESAEPGARSAEAEPQPV